MTEHENLNEEWIGQASKPQLMALARDLGLSIEGKKYQVRNRLLELLKPEELKEVEETVYVDEEVVDLEPDNPNWPKYDDLGSALEALVGTASTSALDYDIDAAAAAEISFDGNNGYLIDNVVATTTSDDLFVVYGDEVEDETPVVVAQVSLPKEITPEFAELRSKRLREAPVFYDDGVLELYKQRLADATSEVDTARITEQVAWLEENGKFEFPFVPEPEEEPESVVEEEPVVEEIPDDGILKEEPLGHTEESLQELTKVQLKDLLRDMGLPVSGRKADLIERILEGQEIPEDNIEEDDDDIDELLEEEDEEEIVEEEELEEEVN